MGSATSRVTTVRVEEPEAKLHRLLFNSLPVSCTLKFKFYDTRVAC